MQGVREVSRAFLQSVLGKRPQSVLEAFARVSHGPDLTFGARRRACFLEPGGRRTFRERRFEMLRAGCGAAGEGGVPSGKAFWGVVAERRARVTDLGESLLGCPWEHVRGAPGVGQDLRRKRFGVCWGLARNGGRGRQTFEKSLFGACRADGRRVADGRRMFGESVLCCLGATAGKALWGALQRVAERRARASELGESVAGPVLEHSTCVGR